MTEHLAMLIQWEPAGGEVGSLVVGRPSETQPACTLPIPFATAAMPRTCL